MNSSDITVHIIDRDNKKHTLIGPTDMSMNIMESNTSLPPQNDDELDMLDQAFFVKNESRLGCQIQLNKDIDGIVLRLAPEA